MTLHTIAVIKLVDRVCMPPIGRIIQKKTSRFTHSFPLMTFLLLLLKSGNFGWKFVSNDTHDPSSDRVNVCDSLHFEDHFIKSKPIFSTRFRTQFASLNSIIVIHYYYHTHTSPSNLTTFDFQLFSSISSLKNCVIQEFNLNTNVWVLSRW